MKAAEPKCYVCKEPATKRVSPDLDNRGGNMKITSEQVEVLNGLVCPDGNGFWQTSDFEDLPNRDADHLIGELKRAVLAKGIDFIIDYDLGDQENEVPPFVQIVMIPDSDTTIAPSADTELEAWILAVTELHGRMGK